MAVKYVPERQCMVCRERFPKKDLIRFVATPAGEVILDATGRQNGRGAYLCRSGQCHAKARKAGLLERQLKHSVQPSVWEQLAEMNND